MVALTPGVYYQSMKTDEILPKFIWPNIIDISIEHQSIRKRTLYICRNEVSQLQL